MQPRSDIYVQALAGSITPVFRIDSWRNGNLLEENIQISGGSLTVTADQAIRSRLTLQVVDEDGRYVPRPDSAVSPYGSQLHVQAGARIGKTDELYSLGWFPVVSAETNESWRHLERPTEPGRIYTISRGSQTLVEATDRAQIVSDDRFLTRTQPTANTVLQEIARLLSGVIPWAGSTLEDRNIPTSVTYESDRLVAITDLANVIGGQFIINEDGHGTVVGPSSPYPVWEIGANEENLGSLISFKRILSRDSMYNAVVASSTNQDTGLIVSAVATIDSGPVRWDGPFGRVPYFYESPVLTTVEQCRAAAQTRLDNIVRQRSQKIPISCTPNYALQVGDTIGIQAPNGKINGEITSITWPLQSGPLMTMVVAVDPFILAEVS